MLARTHLRESGERRQEALSALNRADEQLHEAILEARSAGVNIVELSRLGGVSRPTVYKILRGEER